jgi:hypothetical protein
MLEANVASRTSNISVDTLLLGALKHITETGSRGFKAPVELLDGGEKRQMIPVDATTRKSLPSGVTWNFRTSPLTGAEKLALPSVLDDGIVQL